MTRPVDGDDLVSRGAIAAAEGQLGEAEAYMRALAYLHGLIDWERRSMDQHMRERLLLARPAALLARMGHPERRFRSVLIAGTKGKGSTAAMLESILRAAGVRTGFYSQPHLHSYRERIRVDGVPIDKAGVVAGVDRLQAHVAAFHHEQPGLGEVTTYEAGTALALDHFAQAGVEVSVLEVGLGGRLDATNVVPAEVAVITSLSLDHTAILGETLAEIAGEKAGIIRPQRPIVAAPQRAEALAVLERVSVERGARLGIGGRDWQWSGGHDALAVEGVGDRADLWPASWRHEDLRVPLLGAHQLENAATAVAAFHALGTPGAWRVRPATAVATGLAATRWPARFEVVRRPAGGVVVVDGAHNGDSAAKLAAALHAHLSFERLWVILGVGADKDLPAIVAALAPLAAGAWAVTARHPRSRPADDVAAALIAAGVATQIGAGTCEALNAALRAAGPQDAVCVTGSLFVAAEAREALGLATTRD